MARLTGKSIAEILSHRVEIAREFAVSHRVIVVLKGSRTLIAAPDGGTGDVLTGIIAGLIAQKLDNPLAATIAAVYLHGFAADLAVKRSGIRAMIASDIAAQLGEAFIEVGGEEERLIK
jgi:NAD(P)H-hydrate epimerase